MPDSPSLAERLGFASDSRVAIVHVDDLGMCHAANEGGFAALESGPATCGSIMVPCPWFPEAAAMARANPELDLGVHLTLNAEWERYRWGPVAGAGTVPSLCASDGRLHRTVPEVLQNARPEEVEIELRAQIERALAEGIDVTHLDSHMGTVFMRPFLPVYVKLAIEYRLPTFAVLPDGAALEERGMTDGARQITLLMGQLEKAGIPILDGFDADSLSFEPGGGEAHNAARLDGLEPGVRYLICHAAKGGEELSAIAPEAHCRDFECSFYGGAAGRRALEERGIHTVGMRALRDLVRGEGAAAG